MSKKSAPTTDGGKPKPSTRPYVPPVGPKNQHNPGPGLRGGKNCGPSGTQGKH